MIIPPIAFYPRNIETAAKCPHCGKELPEEDLPIWQLLTVLCVLIWAGITFMFWAFPIGRQPTLVEVLYSQWQWLVGLVSRVW